MEEFIFISRSSAYGGEESTKHRTNKGGRVGQLIVVYNSLAAGMGPSLPIKPAYTKQTSVWEMCVVCGSKATGQTTTPGGKVGNSGTRTVSPSALSPCVYAAMAAVRNGRGFVGRMSAYLAERELKREERTTRYSTMSR